MKKWQQQQPQSKKNADNDRALLGFLHTPGSTPRRSVYLNALNLRRKLSTTKLKSKTRERARAKRTPHRTTDATRINRRGQSIERWRSVSGGFTRQTTHLPKHIYLHHPGGWAESVQFTTTAKPPVARWAIKIFAKHDDHVGDDAKDVRAVENLGPSIKQQKRQQK